MRGQLFTADVIIAVAILAVGLGAILQHAEIVSREASDRILLSSPQAPALAEAIASKQPLIPFHHCAKYIVDSSGTTNGTDACSDASCSSCATFDLTCSGGRVFVSQRLTNCTITGVESACELEVHSCQ